MHAKLIHNMQTSMSNIGTQCELNNIHPQPRKTISKCDWEKFLGNSHAREETDDHLKH